MPQWYTFTLICCFFLEEVSGSPVKCQLFIVFLVPATLTPLHLPTPCFPVLCFGSVNPVTFQFTLSFLCWPEWAWQLGIHNKNSPM